MTHHNHDNKFCKHERLGYCARCDVVYCRDCGREWGAGGFQATGWYYYPVTHPYYPLTYPNSITPPYTITLTASTSGENNTHSHA